jgi:hypothetical protein
LFQHFVILTLRRLKLDCVEELRHAEENAKAEVAALLMADEETSVQKHIGGGVAEHSLAPVFLCGKVERLARRWRPAFTFPPLFFCRDSSLSLF